MRKMAEGEDLDVSQFYTSNKNAAMWISFEVTMAIHGTVIFTDFRQIKY